MRRISALTSIASGIALAAAPASAQTALPVVRIGASPIDSTSEAPYGAEQGIFADNGITPKITLVSGGSTIMAAMLAGDLDVGLANPLSIASAVAHSVPVQMIAPASLYSTRDNTQGLAVAKSTKSGNLKQAVAVEKALNARMLEQVLRLFQQLEVPTRREQRFIRVARLDRSRFPHTSRDSVAA